MQEDIEVSPVELEEAVAMDEDDLSEEEDEDEDDDHDDVSGCHWMLRSNI